ncbi:HNH endonuclease [Pseudomonas sp. v388]|uniref:HNH endonuclease n=1 Tax=Pseudomonas sp. v388 TaxID=2479849 RepID=UPI0021147952|nr:HNH endonuclease [Pseudomonas sp. v388]
MLQYPFPTRRMEKDCFVVKHFVQPVSTGYLASQQLEVGKVYTRDDLRKLFHINASSLNNGIFKPAALDSVWLFVTELKTADRTQYKDILIEDALYMEGQLKGRTDHLIEKHVEYGLELLLFYRKKKDQHAGYGFTYEGRFFYRDHEGAGPTKFTMLRERATTLKLSDIEAELENQGEFDPDDVTDARKRTLASIVRRQGQGSFRKTLLKAYSGQCAVTGCDIEALLEAAHIVPYLGADTNVVANGLLLRADIHTLFDLGLLWVDPNSLLVKLAEALKRSEYSSLEQRPLLLPNALSDRPSTKALQSHLDTLLAR